MSEKNPYKYNGDTLVFENTTDKNSNKSVYIESYGCAMNFSDSEIVASILSKNGYITSDDMYKADLILVNTCSIREKAELTVRKRLEKFNKVRKSNARVKVGVLGCMAERLKHKFLEEEKIVDMVVGPDAYKDLPNLLEDIEDGKSAVNVILSKDETYGALLESIQMVLMHLYQLLEGVIICVLFVLFLLREEEKEVEIHSQLLRN